VQYEIDQEARLSNWACTKFPQELLALFPEALRLERGNQTLLRELPITRWSFHPLYKSPTPSQKIGERVPR
jgi:hypothetical protein